VLSLRGGKWKTEFENTGPAHYGGFIAMGAVGGRPVATYTGKYPPSGAYSHNAMFLEETAGGKWEEVKLALPYNPGIVHCDVGEVGGRAAVLYDTEGGGGLWYGERADGGAWAFEQAAAPDGGHLLDVAGEPACFAAGWHVRKNGKWESSELTERGHTIVGSDAALVGGRPAVAYFDRQTNELHYRALGDGGVWSDQVIDFGSVSFNGSVSLADLGGGRAAVAYIGPGGEATSTTPLVYLEAPPPGAGAGAERK
jgi:hypothetical protein